jgi:putative transposase
MAGEPFSIPTRIERFTCNCSGNRACAGPGYCLMTNHVHLVAVPRKENALANTLRRAHSDYARYANVKLRTSGHFWQNR